MCDSNYCALKPENKSDSGFVESDYLPPLSVLKGLKLKKLDDASGKEVDSESLWKGRDCLIYLVRRPGCALCRNKAKELMEIKSELNAKGIGMAAVVHEELGVEEFKTGFWPSDPIYLNPDLSLFAGRSLFC